MDVVKLLNYWEIITFEWIETKGQSIQPSNWHFVWMTPRWMEWHEEIERAYVRVSDVTSKTELILSTSRDDENSGRDIVDTAPLIRTFNVVEEIIY